MKTQWTTLASSIAATLALAACSTPPQRNSYLDDAHQSYEQAKANGDVARHAQGELFRAREALDRADKAWSDNRDSQETGHLAYLASQRAQVAMNVAAQRAADAR